MINFKRIKWCFNNIIKVSCMTYLAIHKTFVFIKTPFYPFKINKRTTKNISL